MLVGACGGTEAKVSKLCPRDLRRPNKRTIREAGKHKEKRERLLVTILALISSNSLKNLHYVCLLFSNNSVLGPLLIMQLLLCSASI